MRSAYPRPRRASHVGPTCALCIAMFLASSVGLSSPCKAEQPEAPGSDLFNESDDGSIRAPKESGVEEAEPDRSPPDRSPPAEDAADEPAPDDEAPTAPARAPADAAPKRLRVPPEAERADAEKLIRELFKAEYAKRAAADRVALAKKLLEQAGDTPDDEPAARYVLLREARDLAAAAGDVVVAMSAAEEMVAGFRVKRAETKLAAVPPAGRAKDAAELARALIAISNDGIAEEDWAAATKAASLAAVAAGRVRDDKDLALRARLQPGAVTRSRKLATAAADARKKLDADPDDPKANLTLGRYLCFSRGDWTAGVPHLASSNDPALKDLAQRELSAPRDATEMAALGDAWWKAAEAPAWKDDAAALRQRAAHWYQKALPDLAGIAQAVAAKRVAQANPVAGNRIDLMPHLKPARDGLAGSWALVKGELVGAPAAEARAQLPYRPPAEYDFLMRFTRVSGTDAVAQLFPQGDGRLQWIMGGWGDKVLGIGVIDGKHAHENETTVKGFKGLVNGRKYTSLVRVRAERVEIFLDGELVVGLDTRGRGMQAMHEWALRDGACLGLGAMHCKVVFHDIEVVEVSGRGKFVR